MKNTHGKCFIISSSSPTALWHDCVIRKDLCLPAAGSLVAAQNPGRRPKLCHFLSDRLGGICSYFLLATALVPPHPPPPHQPPPWPHAPWLSGENSKMQSLRLRKGTGHGHKHSKYRTSNNPLMAPVVGTQERCSPGDPEQEKGCWSELKYSSPCLFPHATCDFSQEKKRERESKSRHSSNLIGLFMNE